jgi:2,3-bisphosphoglycerate-independent phosphoglycerate mutase
LRGFDSYPDIPTMHDRFGLRAVAVASYPMYRGLARLVGMELHPLTATVEEEFAAVRDRFDEFDFFFVHVKATDSRGEDGDFAGKVKVIEEVDALLPQLTGLNPDVLVVTGDHSTPAILKSHSWHPVPVLLSSRFARRDPAETFGETACLEGSIGQRSMLDLMSLALAHAGRLTKFGA